MKFVPFRRKVAFLQEKGRQIRIFYYILYFYAEACLDQLRFDDRPSIYR